MPDALKLDLASQIPTYTASMLLIPSILVLRAPNSKFSDIFDALIFGSTFCVGSVSQSIFSVAFVHAFPAFDPHALEHVLPGGPPPPPDCAFIGVSHVHAPADFVGEIVIDVGRGEGTLDEPLHSGSVAQESPALSAEHELLQNDPASPIPPDLTHRHADGDEVGADDVGLTLLVG